MKKGIFFWNFLLVTVLGLCCFMFESFDYGSRHIAFGWLFFWAISLAVGFIELATGYLFWHLLISVENAQQVMLAGAMLILIALCSYLILSLL